MKEPIISLIANGVFSTPLPDNFPKSFSAQEAEKLYRIAKKHDLAQIVASALKKHQISLPAEVEAKFQKQLFLSVFRCEKLQHELMRLSDAMEQAGIPFITLKGSVLRLYYPESWMRTSADIDLLIVPDDLDRASKVIVEKVGYREKGQWNGERSFFSPDGIHLELHFYDEADEEEGEIFREMWNYATPCENKESCMKVEWEFFYAHHVTHMAKHFSHGGCGIRPFLDLALLREKIPMDAEKKREYTEHFGVSVFAEAAEHLSSVWFGDAEHTPLTEKMQDYLLDAGIFGSVSNQIALEKGGKGKRMNGLSAHIWVPYDVIRHQYPVLNQHKWLLPLCQVRRWCKLIFCGGLKRSVHYVRKSRSMGDEAVEKVAGLMDELKLS